MSEPGEIGVPRPFLKWAGGKTQLLSQFQALYPHPRSIRRYIEPFVGSGAVFFKLRRLAGLREVLLADNNEELINVYVAVRDHVEGVIAALRRHKALHSKEHYYEVRAKSLRRMSSTARAARLIYLNKTCFNGLYRVNSKGGFNVPMGRYQDPPILNAENLRAAGQALEKTGLKAAHFRKTLDVARKGDFIYFDPPYHPLSKTSFFTSYTEGAFTASDQKDLAEVYSILARRGCRVMLSNSDCPFIRGLYEGFDIRSVSARRNINSKAEKRGRIGEVVVLNYEPAGTQEPSEKSARP
jgi:DNA adenine methylase